MSLSKPLSKTLNSLDLEQEDRQFLVLNRQILAELLTFIDFADGFTLGFVEVNFPPDVEFLIEALKSDPKCQNIQFEVLNFSHRPDLKFLRDEIVQQLPILPHDPSRKLVLLIRGLEKSIGVDLQGDYPPVLQDLNFVRDAYKSSVPHPLLFILPDYALTRLTKFAPDFWAWRSGVFLFQTPQTTKDYALVRTLEADRSIDSSGPPESSERIALLESLLMDYRPSPGHPPTDIDLNTCNILFHQLGVAYLSQRNATKAQKYLEKALELAQQRQDVSLAAEIYQGLGSTFAQQRRFNEAQKMYQEALNRFSQLGNQRGEANTLHYLGSVALDLRNFSRAESYYQQCLTMKRQLGDRYSQARTLHQLGIVAQELREWEQARSYYQQALESFIEYGDRYEQAGTLHQLGRVAEGVGELSQAKSYYLQALQIWSEFNDGYIIQTYCLPRLVALYQQTQDKEILVGIASVFGVGVEELRGLLEG